MMKGVRASGRQGVTIVEMVVVLTIIGIVAAAVVPALRPLGVRRDVLVESRSALMSVLTSARRRAITDATTLTLTLDPETARYWMHEAEPTDSMIRGAHFDSASVFGFPEGVTLTGSAPRLHFVFSPSGTVSGEPIAIRVGSRVQPIALDPRTGALVERPVVTDDVLGSRGADVR
ncbi:MAG TPA: type II secretion system protein [Gemmatimonadaceae bacterium]|nr:type II secretion system protein [Gemmatimonadaceae bacterium]